MDIKDEKSAREFIQAWAGNGGLPIMCRIAAEGQRSCANISRSQGYFTESENYEAAARLLEVKAV